MQRIISLATNIPSLGAGGPRQHRDGSAQSSSDRKKGRGMELRPTFVAYICRARKAVALAVASTPCRCHNVLNGALMVKPLDPPKSHISQNT